MTDNYEKTGVDIVANISRQEEFRRKYVYTPEQLKKVEETDKMFDKWFAVFLFPIIFVKFIGHILSPFSYSITMEHHHHHTHKHM